jgi:hypothetical protein
MRHHFHRLWQIAVAALVLTPAAASAQPPRAQQLRVVNDGDGIVASTDRRISCGNDCTARYRRGKVVTLFASDGTDFVFRRWTAGCVGTATRCVVALDRPATVRAQYARLTRTVRASAGGPGSIVSTPAGIRCGVGVSGCDGIFGKGTAVSFTAVPGPDGAFAAWRGDCAGTTGPTCTLTLDEAKVLSAAFGHASPAAGDQTLSVTADMTRVTSDPAGIDCPSICTAAFPSGTAVTLSAGFGSWGGACSGIGLECPVIVDAPTGVSAQGLLLPPPPPPPPRRLFGVNVSVAGPGVVSGGTGTRRAINCGRRARLLDCEGLFPLNASVRLRARPHRGGRFARWSGFCTGKKKRCTVRATAAKTVSALFRR